MRKKIVFPDANCVVTVESLDSCDGAIYANGVLDFTDDQESLLFALKAFERGFVQCPEGCSHPMPDHVLSGISHAVAEMAIQEMADIEGVTFTEMAQLLSVDDFSN